MKDTTYLSSKLFLLIMLLAGTVSQAQTDSAPVQRAKVHHIEPLFRFSTRPWG